MRYTLHTHTHTYTYGGESEAAAAALASSSSRYILSAYIWILSSTAGARAKSDMYPSARSSF